MPSLSDLLKVAVPVGAQVTGGILNRRAVGNAVGNLSQGANQAMNTINTGAQTARQTLADVFKGQKATLQPFEQAGTKSLADLSAGVAPGGGLADPFSYDMEKFWADPQIQRRIAEGNKFLAHKQASGGSLSSGAALKAARDYNDYQIGNEFGKERSAQEEIFRANQQQKYNALMGVTNLGANAANQEVLAGGTYGANLSKLETGTAEQIAGLQTDLASAQAAGDIQKANTITDTINGILDTVGKSGILTPKPPPPSLSTPQGYGTAYPNPQAPVGADPNVMADPYSSSPQGEAPSAVQTAAALAPAAIGTGLTLASAAPAAAASTPSVSVAIPELGILGSGAAEAGVAGTAAAAAPGAEAAGVTASGASGSSLIPLLTNPYTIAVAAGIIAVTAWIKSQAHHEANSWVKGFQNPFDQKMDQVNRQFLSAAQSGQMTKEQALAARQSAQEAISQYQSKLSEFASKGSDERKVASQAQRTADEQYGPNFSKWLGQWDSLIQQLPEAA